MNNIVTQEQAQTNKNPLAAILAGGVPAYLEPFKEETRISFGTGALNLPALSVRAGKFSLRKGQEYTPLGTEIEAIVFALRENNSQVYYDRKFTGVAGEDSRPRCYSIDGRNPAANVKDKICDTCARCPMNVWGSDVDGPSKKGKLCKDRRRLILLVKVNNAYSICYFDLPGSSLKHKADQYGNMGFADFYNYITGHKMDISSVAAMLRFDPATMMYSKTVFAPFRVTSEYEMQLIREAKESEDVEAALIEGVPEQDHEPSTQQPYAPVAQAPVAPVVQAPVYAQAPVAPVAPAVQMPAGTDDVMAALAGILG